MSWPAPRQHSFDGLRKLGRRGKGMSDPDSHYFRRNPSSRRFFSIGSKDSN
jgi:hypothetical protein